MTVVKGTEGRSGEPLHLLEHLHPGQAGAGGRAARRNGLHLLPCLFEYREPGNPDAEDTASSLMPTPVNQGMPYAFFAKKILQPP